MFNAIFAGRSDSSLFNNVYNDDVKQILYRNLNFAKIQLEYDNFKENKDILKSIEYIFAYWGMPHFSEQEISEYFPSLKAIFYSAGSVQGFALPFINCGVKVFSAAPGNAIPVAEFASAQIILANKGYYQGVIKYKNEGCQSAHSYCHSFSGNYGNKIGILGAGMIGKEVIRILKSYNLQLFVFDPFLSIEKANELGVRLTSLQDIFSECSVISNHLANKIQTQGLLNYSLFSKMQDKCTFINTGRGAQVVESDLIRSLKEKPNRTALLDVTFPEPPIEGNELYNLGNVFLTPHIAGSMNNEIARMGIDMCEEYLAFSEGKPTRYEVTLEMLKIIA